MYTNIENSLFYGPAIAVTSLLLVALLFSLFPIIIFDQSSFSKKVVNRCTGIFRLTGFVFWIYLMFYLELL
ncbi:hypothetical protein ACFFIX_05120 [Metabacillus herbersteinensis]|uniref:Uncharacterized protein n=1 Tax=Metabacillus herbersteinensis TaxID=283816 RepID=A0ABV6GAX2_9BACI